MATLEQEIENARKRLERLEEKQRARQEYEDEILAFALLDAMSKINEPERTSVARLLALAEQSKAKVKKSRAAVKARQSRKKKSEEASSSEAAAEQAASHSGAAATPTTSENEVVEGYAEQQDYAVNTYEGGVQDAVF